uniref:Uncharacterized protein n=1 Tax=Rhizophora mucronata TaxID=61149 RepID=A0A2P2PUD3_RHIMU
MRVSGSSFRSVNLSSISTFPLCVCVCVWKV